MEKFFKGFEDLIELAKTLEEKVETGELKTDIRVNSRPLTNIPSQGNIPRTQNRDQGGMGVENLNNASTSETEETPPSTSFSEIGGLKPIIQELTELVGIPLKRPQWLEQLGLEPTTGVLLVGPPGTGKTLTAKALAQSLGVNYIALVGSEIMSKYYGEAEARMRGIFEKAARHAPCILFIDELDSIAPDRAKVEGEVEKRVVGQLLSLMDGFTTTSGVVLLGATNRPNHLDPALRRPGRFDREVVFGVPDVTEREEILRVLTRKMPLAETVDLKQIAQFAVGFVGADLKALTQKAAYTVLRNAISTENTSFEAIDLPETVNLTQGDFLEALKEVKPSVLRTVSVETPVVSWDEIGGLVEIKRTLREAVEGALLYPELYQQTGAKAPRGILLWGEPGTGKTLLAKALASQARANFISIKGAELLNRWVGASEEAVREVFSKARQVAPCVLFIDEIDTLAPARGRYQGDSGVSDRVVGQILTEIDGIVEASNVLVVAATNRYESLDPALLRSGRLDLQLQVALPDYDSRLAILNIHNRDRPLADVNLEQWAQTTEGWNGADLELLSNQAALSAVRNATTQGIQNLNGCRITPEDFQSAYERLTQQRSRC
ncbi:Adenosinetriphosphatase [Halothece sp. PCC 7418]|uniref:AAA family ATPase n=1 Tax=Halothece sp. (strain PCC 7418) TaxID=65093 RepID=UPI0002A06BC2|nr:AAA family ATPase [Halothece sp. PCC 7418]AFZ43723.1 Adenosinetriphosphatase [Halothece sp. PCC 7418]